MIIPDNANKTSNSFCIYWHNSDVIVEASWDLESTQEIIHDKYDKKYNRKFKIKPLYATVIFVFEFIVLSAQ